MSDHVVLCSIHFEDCNFTVKRNTAATLGIKLTLKPDAISSIDAANNREETDTLPAIEKRTVRQLILISFSLLSGADPELTLGGHNPELDFGGPNLCEKFLTTIVFYGKHCRLGGHSPQGPLVPPLFITKMEIRV